MTSPQDQEAAYHALCCYTLAHAQRDPAFVHQHVVDAYAAQHATPESKRISVAFSLAGLYLHVEKGFSGRQVQRAHMELARTKREWPAFALPADRGAVTALDVMAAAEGVARDRAIDTWCQSVWVAYQESRAALIALLREHGMA